MSRLIPAVAALAAALVAVTAGGAITYGTLDGNRHPEVGALLAPQAYSDGTWATCTGTLIAPQVFLTAAHCEGEARVAVSFASTYEAGKSKVYWGDWVADPAYSQAQGDPHDLAVVLLDKPVKGINPARLPAAGSLADLSGDQQLTSVGYGAYLVTSGPGGKTFHYDDTRLFATGTLNAVTPSWLRISQNPTTGNAGTCYGDSGGPNFLGAGATETDVVAGVTVTGDTPCRSTNVDYRLDTPSARAFLGQFVALP